jgi:pheromone shutdown protein TraB
LIGSEGTALRASCTGAGRATVASDEVAAWILLTTASRRPTVVIAVSVPIAVAASVGLVAALIQTTAVAASFGSVAALIQTTDAGSVALYVRVGELLRVNRVPVLARVIC